RLEKQPTDPATAGRCHHYMRDGTLWSSMADLRLVAGLGNPGLEYRSSRHNVGFMVIDCFAGKKGVMISRSADWSSELGKWGDILLIKPLAYMNRSGEVISRFA